MTEKANRQEAILVVRLPLSTAVDWRPREKGASIARRRPGELDSMKSAASEELAGLCVPELDHVV